MSDLAFLPSSPWMSDFLPSKEALLATDYGLPFDLENTDFSQDLSAESQLWTDLHSSVSVANSECSDGVSVDIDGDLEDSILLSGLDGVFTSSSVDTTTNKYTNEVTLSEELNINVANEEDVTIGNGYLQDDEEHNYTAAPHIKRSSFEALNHNISWSRLSTLEQHQLADDLSLIISKELGLREQLEVIRIINPHAAVSPTDTEFTIDLSCLDDEKLERVQEFVHQQLSPCSHHSSRSRTQPRRPRHYHQGVSSPSDQPSSTTTVKSSHRKTSKRAVNQPIQRESRQKQRKRSRQQLKEKKSGLFVQEQILPLGPITAPIQDDEVDILT